MSRFPKKEAQIQSLALNIALGMWNNYSIYPNPPVNPIALDAQKDLYINAKNNSIAAQAAAEQATADKEEALENLIEALKNDIRYAENTVDYDDDQLKLIGWAGRKTRTQLAVPGQTRLLEVPKQGAGWLKLDWKAPADGGRPAAYTIERRERPAGPWETIATAIQTEATLVEQPERIELEYRVFAINKSGSGTTSNTVMVVL